MRAFYPYRFCHTKFLAPLLKDPYVLDEQQLEDSVAELCKCKFSTLVTPGTGQAARSVSSLGKGAKYLLHSKDPLSGFLGLHPYHIAENASG